MATTTTPRRLEPVKDDVFGWDDLDRQPDRSTLDALGLTPEDRSSLGLSAPRPNDLQALPVGDAHAALVEAMATGTGGALGKDKRAKKR